MSQQPTSSIANIPIHRRESQRSRRLRLTVAGGEITLTVPRGTRERVVQKFLQEKQVWIEDKQQKLASTAQKHPDIATTNKEHYHRYQKAALELAQQKVIEWNQELQLDFNAVRVRRMKTRWGSCTAKRNLHFNYKILFLPEDVQDYLVVHELCHLKHPNHSVEFWGLVADVLPDYKNHHQQLRELM